MNFDSQTEILFHQRNQTLSEQLNEIQSSELVIDSDQNPLVSLINKYVIDEPYILYSQLFNLTIPKLKILCKNLNIKGYSRCKNKINLLNHISEYILKDNHIEFSTLKDYKSYIIYKKCELNENYRIYEFITDINNYSVTGLNITDCTEEKISIELTNIIKSINKKYENDYYIQGRDILNSFLYKMYDMYKLHILEKKSRIPIVETEWDRIERIRRQRNNTVSSEFPPYDMNQEEYLYHGTDLNNIDSILNDDFSLTINPRHGCRFGKGIYFTNDLELAMKYSEIHLNKKYVFVCKVYIGDICRGEYNMDKLPMNNNTGIVFDTAVDSLNNPKQFIKFKNHQYLIIGLLEIDLFNKLNKRYIPQNKKDEQIRLRANILQYKKTSSFNSKLYLDCFRNINTISLHWLKPTAIGYKEVKFSIPVKGKCIYTNIGEKFIIKNINENIIINRITIKKNIEHIKIY